MSNNNLQGGWLMICMTFSSGYIQKQLFVTLKEKDIMLYYEDLKMTCLLNIGAFELAFKPHS